MRSDGQSQKSNLPSVKGEESPIFDSTSMHIQMKDSSVQETESAKAESADIDAVDTPSTPLVRTVNPSMRNQMSSSRAMTVELNTLKDMTPKLVREVNTYTISECQHIKELAKNLPFCQEHRDVRFNLVLEEIHRLRTNRSNTLEKLKETRVKIAELEFRLELSSFQAGEIFWDQKLAQLSNSESVSLNNPQLASGSKDFRSNFEYAPVIGQNSAFTRDTGHRQYGTKSISNLQLQMNAMEDGHAQGLTELGEGLTIDPVSSSTDKLQAIKHTLVDSIESFKRESEIVQSTRPLETNNLSPGTVNGNQDHSTNPREFSARIASGTAASDLSQTAKIVTTGPGSELDCFSSTSKEEIPRTEIDDLISSVEETKRKSKIIRKKVILLSAIPSAALIGLLILELETKAISSLLNLVR